MSPSGALRHAHDRLILRKNFHAKNLHNDEQINASRRLVALRQGQSFRNTLAGMSMVLSWPEIIKSSSRKRQTHLSSLPCSAAMGVGRMRFAPSTLS